MDLHYPVVEMWDYFRAFLEDGFLFFQLSPGQIVHFFHAGPVILDFFLQLLDPRRHLPQAILVFTVDLLLQLLQLLPHQSDLAVQPLWIYDRLLIDVLHYRNHTCTYANWISIAESISLSDYYNIMHSSSSITFEFYLKGKSIIDELIFWNWLMSIFV